MHDGVRDREPPAGERGRAVAARRPTPGGGPATAAMLGIPTPAGVLALQRSAGNAATGVVVQRGLLGDIWDRGVFDGSMLAQADPGLPRSLITHYMRASGASYDLTRAEMLEVDASVNVFSFAAVRQARNQLIAQAEADPAPSTDYRQFTAPITGARGHGGANKNQTLGNFTVTLDGTLTVTKGRNGDIASFEGTATYYDYWDFDPKPMQTFVDNSSGRTTAGELKTWVGALMEGQPFPVNSRDSVRVTQDQFDTRARIS